MKIYIFKNALFFLIISIISYSCISPSILKSSQDGRVDIIFIDNPKKIEAGKEYLINLIDKENPGSPLYPSINHGMIARKSELSSGHYVYILRPGNSKEITLIISSPNKGGGAKVIDKLILNVK